MASSFTTNVSMIEMFGTLRSVNCNGKDSNLLADVQWTSNTRCSLIEQGRLKCVVVPRSISKYFEALCNTIIQQEIQQQFANPLGSSELQTSVTVLAVLSAVLTQLFGSFQVQGVLTAASELWPHIHISDSLLMADSAVKMVEAGCRHIAVLGVDFMSENVRAILDRAGHEDIQVSSLACSLDHSHICVILGTIMSNSLFTSDGMYYKLKRH